MSLTVIYRGKYIKFSTALNKPQWMLGLLLSGGALLWAFNYYRVVDAERVMVEDQLKNAQSEYRDQKDNLAQLKGRAEDQLMAMQLKIGELQGQVNRIDAFSAELAKVANIPEGEFDFSAPPPIGGELNEVALDTVVPEGSALMLQIDDLLLQLDGQQQKMALLESVLLNHNIEKGSYLSGRPVTSGWLSSYYGMRKDPFTGLLADHKGIDFAAKQGDEVIATGAGVISWAGERFGYGQLVEIDHGDGFKTRYGHNETLLVKIGDVVDKGQLIAQMGSSGRSTGPHVHYEILKGGKQINPLNYVYRQTK